MLCPRCGTDSPGDVKYCWRCGAGLTNVPAPARAKPVPVRSEVFRHPVDPLSIQTETTAYETITAPVDTSSVPLNCAGFWRRFAAATIDGIIILAAAGIIYTPVALVAGLVSAITKMEGMELFRATSFLLSGINILIRAGSWFYYAGMESSPWQATLGKMALGLAVTDMDGKRINFGKATFRYFCKAINDLTLGLGYLTITAEPKHQGLHDEIAGTYVLKKS